LFESLYEIEGQSLARTIDAIRKAASKRGDPFAAVEALVDKRES
jgi:hypothetical protein